MKKSAKKIKSKRTQKGSSYIKKTQKRDLKKCAPNNNNNNFSCFGKPALLRICKSWNDFYKEDPISYTNNLNIDQLWNKLDDKLRNKCNNEWCWMEQEFVKKANINTRDIFRPSMPKKWYDHEREWLNTTDIENVMQQYEKKYDDFKFIGPVPIDFDYKPHPGTCIVNELCKINLTQLLKKGIHKLGVIFNLDPHDKPGSHWVALYSDVKDGGVYYFDSYGVEPPKEVKDLMNRLTKQGKNHNNKMNADVNKVRHQFKNSECGVYSMHFIINLLEGKSFKEVTENIIKDDDMLKNRDVYYVRQE